jgi:hypothetical protein
MYVLGVGMTLNIASVIRVDKSCNEGDVGGKARLEAVPVNV